VHKAATNINKLMIHTSFNISKDPQKCLLKIHMGVKMQTLMLILNFKKAQRGSASNTAFSDSEPISKSLRKKFFYVKRAKNSRKKSFILTRWCEPFLCFLKKAQ
jgi:hypothetical protein